MPQRTAVAAAAFAANDGVSGNVLYSVGYKLNNIDQRYEADVVRVVPGGSGLETSFYWLYDYDSVNADQLKSAGAYTMGGVPIADRQFAYDFDAAGNNRAVGWGANALNQVILTPGYESALQYDDRGNLIDDVDLDYTYDAQDRLIEVSGTSKRMTFGYDADGRRVWEKIYSGSTVTHLRFAYVGQSLWGVFKVETDGSNTLVRSYTWGPDVGDGMPDLLGVTDWSGASAVSYGALLDGNGNVMGLAGASGAVAAVYEYSPFGELLASEGTAKDVNQVRFSSLYYDDLGVRTNGNAAAVYYAANRYYSPNLMRWLTRDPMGEEGGA